jgi:hypothetical protein
MLFVIESNVFYASDQMNFIEALQSTGKRHLLVDYIPFSHEIWPMPKDPSDCIAFGSTNMIRTLLDSPNRHWVYSTETLTVDNLLHRWDGLMLNGGGRMTTLGELDFAGHAFVRPMDDLKSFAGGVVDVTELDEWRERVISYSKFSDEDLLTSETKVWVAPTKSIQAEYRFFIVDGIPVAYCRYRKNGILKYVNDVPKDVIDFVQLNIYMQKDLPRGYVLDVARINDTYKIIEINCINSAGLYSCDVNSIIRALDRN